MNSYYVAKDVLTKLSVDTLIEMIYNRNREIQDLKDLNSLYEAKFIKMRDCFADVLHFKADGGKNGA